MVTYVQIYTQMERRVYNVEDYHIERIELKIVRERYNDGFEAYHVEIGCPLSTEPNTPLHKRHASMKEAMTAYKAAYDTLRYQGFTSSQHIQFGQRGHNPEELV